MVQFFLSPVKFWICRLKDCCITPTSYALVSCVILKIDSVDLYFLIVFLVAVFFLNTLHLYLTRLRKDHHQLWDGSMSVSLGNHQLWDGSISASLDNHQLWDVSLCNSIIRSPLTYGCSLYATYLIRVVAPAL